MADEAGQGWGETGSSKTSEPLLPPDTPGISLGTMRGKKETVTLGIHSF